MRDFASRFPSELGDGMKKRVAIARRAHACPRATCCSTSRTTSLDPVSAQPRRPVIRELSDTLGVTSIVVSHDLTSIFSIADRIVMLYKGKVK
jgi:phospholipid/cholesterol/gamma-HCH transport system ATP-binding protein